MTSTIGIDSQRRKAVWGPKRSLAFAATVALVAGLASNALAAGPQRPPAAKAVPGAPGSSVKPYKLDKALTDRAAHGNPIGVSTVIVRLVPGGKLPAEFKKYAHGGSLDIINALVLDVPNGALKALANNPNVASVHDDRPVKTHNYRTSVTVGARAVQDFLGYTGAGVGVAVIDSGVATWHDDLTNKTSKIYPYGNQRVAKFVDFVNGRALPYDDNGHGSHVAGIIAGNGYDSLGEKAGIAPGASLVSLKVLDANGQGTISSIIAALNWIATNNKTYNIRVVNLSVGAPIHESYWTDPLTLACKRVNDLGITIVVAAGNMGKNAAGQLQWGAITAPGNAPWVLTVGASSTMGTLTRLDDTMAGFSSSGPTFIDYNAKPDLVAPGVGTVSLAVPGSTFYATKTSYLLAGKLSLGYKPYLTLSGTSMAAPVVSGSIALMLQANPNLTPNLIKAILQYTAQQYPGYSALRQGAGFVNTLGAVRLAKFYADNRAGTQMPTQ
ncbi:MAG TPA: S8 family peptidase, partial [Vicinamibacterales bacterium]